jgi:hypothetical protein
MRRYLSTSNQGGVKRLEHALDTSKVDSTMSCIHLDVTGAESKRYNVPDSKTPKGFVHVRAGVG